MMIINTIITIILIDIAFYIRCMTNDGDTRCCLVIASGSQDLLALRITLRSLARWRDTDTASDDKETDCGDGCFILHFG